MTTINPRAIKVFVSSVSRGMEAVRNQVIADLTKAGYDVGAMELFGAQPTVPLEVCLSELRTSDAVVLIIGPRYGSLLGHGISYTHAEYREAQGAKIPVFAFRITDEGGLDSEESQRLEGFATEVGSTTTYESLAPNEALARVSPLVLAALSGARNRGEIGRQFSVFQKYEKFFAGELTEDHALFRHDGPFVGREPQLEHLLTFLAGAEPLLLIKAAGGSGKSRLLLEAARAPQVRADGPQMFFADPAALWSAADISLLPRTSSAVIVFDDGHRRPDLDRLIAACRQHNDAMRYIVSCRPSAVAVVTPLISSLLASGSPPQLEVPRLAKRDAVALARHHLGDAWAQFAERLVAVADSNPLVVRVGAKCIAEDRVLPEVLERTPEAFRRVVLDRLLLDPLFTGSNASATRRILQIIAAIGPVITENDELTKQLAEEVTLREDEIRRSLARLERAGFLLRRGRFVRVSPDVLADHLLYVAAVDELGKPSGFVERMVTLFWQSLENILANAAELDWRSETVDGPDSVLKSIWRDLLDLLPTVSHSQRAELVKQLRRAAIFAPNEVVRICQWLIQHQDAPRDDLLTRWGLPDSPDRVNDAIAEVLATIATHPDFTKRCASMLWALGELDHRPENPNPNHPRRRLADLLGYEPRTGWRSPNGAQVKAMEFLIERLRSPDRTNSAPWAVSALAGLLRRTGEDNTWTRRVFTLREFTLASFLREIGERRARVVNCLVDIALDTKLEEAAAALAELSKTLSPPRGAFGKGLEDDETAVWQVEAEAVILSLRHVAFTASSDVVRFLARRELRSVRQEHWPDIAPAVNSALASLPPAPSEQLYDLLVGIPWVEQLDDWRAEETRVEQLTIDAAKAFWQTHSSCSLAVGTLIDAIGVFQGIDRSAEPRTGHLVRALVLTSPHPLRNFVAELVSQDAGWLLRPALLGVHDRDPALAETLVDELSRSSDAVIRASAIEAVQWMVDRPSSLASLVDVALRLSQDESPLVRRATAHAVRRLAKHSQAEARAILIGIEWSGDVHVGDDVLRSIDKQHGVDPEQLSDADIDVLLGRIESLRTLEGRNYELLEFIGFASKRRPSQTLSMLLRRVLKTDEHRADSKEDWVPLPYNGHGLDLNGIGQATGHHELLRTIRDATPDARLLARFWLPTLFQAADPSLAGGRIVLREWLSALEAEKVVATATLLRGFEHSVIFTEHELIADIVGAASRLGPECLDNTRGELFSVAISGVFGGTPGQPAPRHLQDRESAAQLAERYSVNEPVRDFYQALVASAESSIRRDVELWDEGDDE